MPDACDLDHVALGLSDREPFWDLFARQLGGAWVGGGDSVGFSSAQVRFRNGMKVEALEPFLVERNDFLARFLARSGNGPHHLTYKVPDLQHALERVRRAGIDPVGIDLSDPGWKEAFLHPKQSHGIVIQLAQSSGDWSEPTPDWYPAPRPTGPASLLHVTHAVADLEGALELFKGLLGAVTVDAGAGGGLGWVDLAWPGPGRVRLVSGAAVAPWLDGRAGRLHHLAFSLVSPGLIPGAVAGADCWVMRPEPALGTRLVLVEEGMSAPPLVSDPAG